MDRESRTPGALIIGGSFHSLGAARNLAKHGVPVYVLDGAPCVSQFSRCVRRFLKCPAAEDEAGLVRLLLHLASDNDLKGWCLFPSTDDSVRVVSQHRESLSEHYALTIPGWDVLQHVCDKRLTHRLAVQQGVPVPVTHNPNGTQALESLDVDFPVVIKPAAGKRFMSVTRQKAYRANDVQELLDLYGTMAAIVDPSEILVQELIPGRGENLYSFVGFFKDGAPVAGLSARRPRQHPMEFGRASTYVQVVDVPELERLSTQLLRGISYSGLAEVEFMYDPRHARFELLEVNPRLWGWHTITIRAGLDLPYMAYAYATGEEIKVGSPRYGVKWVRLVTDFPTAVSEMLSGRLAVRQYLSSMRGDVEFAVLSLRDPLPFIADLFLGPYNYFRNRGF